MSKSCERATHQTHTSCYYILLCLELCRLLEDIPQYFIHSCFRGWWDSLRLNTWQESMSWRGRFTNIFEVLGDSWVIEWNPKLCLEFCTDDMYRLHNFALIISIDTRNSPIWGKKIQLLCSVVQVYVIHSFYRIQYILYPKGIFSSMRLICSNRNNKASLHLIPLSQKTLMWLSSSMMRHTYHVHVWPEAIVHLTHNSTNLTLWFLLLFIYLSGSLQYWAPLRNKKSFVKC